MAQLTTLYRYSIGKKLVMAVTGLILFGFLVGHLLGNLKVFMGPEVFNHYAEGLRSLGSPIMADEQALWLARLVLLAALIAHVVAMVQLVQMSRAARPVAYHRHERISFSSASHLMLTGGLVIAAFVVYHLLHLTFGVVHPDFKVVQGEAMVYADAYHNVITGFRSPPVVIAYLVALLALGAHLYHGLWSSCQTLGLNHPKYNHLRRPIALAVAALMVLGYASIPVAVMLGLVR